MKEEHFLLLKELKLKYSFEKYGEYKDWSFYRELWFYSFKNSQLSIILHPEGKPLEHIELIQSIVNDLLKTLPKDYKYKLCIDGWYCNVQNGDLKLEFIDGRYYIKSEHQEMHNRKEVATIMDVVNLNNIAIPEFKWNILKKKSIELGFTPVKDKSGQENLYLIEAFKVCYPEYNYVFSVENELPKDLDVEPKRKKFLGLF
jgi:hypothetical protein